MMINKFKLAIKNKTGSIFWAKKSFAQEGEDLVLDRLIEKNKSGFYVDIGCHHPFRFSNTYLFYRRGWSGLCFDPLPGTKALFEKWRTRDLVIETGVSLEPSRLTYHMFNDPALNTFDGELAKKRNGFRDYKIIECREIVTNTLSNLLDTYLKKDQKIDFFSIDVEGFDLEVLQSNNWGKYRPQFIVTECLEADLGNIKNDSIADFLIRMGYLPYAKTGHSIVFVGHR